MKTNEMFKKILIALLYIVFVFFSINSTLAVESTVTTSTFSKLWDIVLMARNFAGICCLCIVLVAVFKLIIGDENDNKKYITRIKNALIALVLILTIVNLTNVVINSLMNGSTDYYSIGDISSTSLDDVDGDLDYGISTSISDIYDLVEDNIDKENLQDGESGLYDINGAWYYVSDYKAKKNLGGWWESYKVSMVYTLKSYSDNTKTFYATDTNSQDPDKYSFYSTSSGNKVKVILDCTNSVTYKSLDEFLDGILYALESTEQDGVQYYTDISDNVEAKQ